MASSPAIDAGSNALVPAGLALDLDGEPRFVDIEDVADTGEGSGPIVDLGAFEANAPEVCPGDCDGSGDVSFQDLVGMLFEFGVETNGGCDADGSGEVSFADLVAALFRFGPC